jgi:mono/diheme cytochrome c family protein
MNSLGNMSLVLVLSLGGLAFAGSATRPANPGVSGSSPLSTESDQQWRIEGEKRYRANCGRCHQPPHKLPPRAMAMAIRHMRVRAMLTDDDVKYVLYYMTH